MEMFVRENSIVRKIWGSSDTILFIFAAASAEFALNKAVDWLFFTGRLPADPIGRLFSTVAYAREIVFSDAARARAVVDRMAHIHREVEQQRGAKIPDWAYRDVLFMLIDYSIRSHELLYEKLSLGEKEEVYDVFHRVGSRMGLVELPADYTAWTGSRESHLRQDLVNSDYTIKLYRQYRLHLGAVRYRILLLAQSLVVPDYVRDMLHLRKWGLSGSLVKAYKLMLRSGLDIYAKKLILPSEYIDQVLALDSFPKHR